MTAVRRTIRSVGVLAAGLLAATGATAGSIRVMTFNVRYASDEGPERWAVRRPVMVELIRRAAPDVIGTQELLQRQGDDLTRALPGYRWFGRDRRGGHRDEHMGIFYRPDRLTLIDRGDFWLSDTPDTVGSRSWGTDLPRMASWAIFATKEATPHRFLFVDTHLAHRDEDAGARDKAAALILARLPALARDLPVVLAGDMNARPDTAAYRRFATGLTDAWPSAARREGPEMTFHDFTGTPDRRIDYIFLRGFRSERIATDTYHQCKTYPSDHFPIEATLTFDHRNPPRYGEVAGRSPDGGGLPQGGGVRHAPSTSFAGPPPRSGEDRFPIALSFGPSYDR